MTKKILLLAIITFTIFFANPLLVQADERLVNGGFETGDTSGWTIFVQNASLQVVDSSEGPVRTGDYSGAISLGGTQSGGHVGQSIEFATQPPQGGHFALAGWVYVPSGETNFDLARVRVRYYETSDCENSIVLFNSTLVINDRDEWIPFQFITEIPAGVECVTPLLEISRLDTGAPLTVYWDDVTFYDSTPTAVSLLSATTGTADFIYPPFWLMAGLLAVLSWSFFRRKEAAQT